MNKFLQRDIPLWLMLLICLLTISGSLFFVMFMRGVVYQHNLYVPWKDGQLTMLEYGSYPQFENVEFFGEVKKKLIEDKIKFIEADLQTMEFRIYENSEVIYETKIVAKGREGSWWETPAGIYKVEYKNKNHVSSIFGVTMPWSMQFHGSFFIHGWPIHPDGRPVHSAYSGGCMRLQTKDAEEVFDLVNVGVPVLVYAKTYQTDEFDYSTHPKNLSSKGYIAADLKNNFVFLEKGPDDAFPIGSVTKVMTALVATEYLYLERYVVVSKAVSDIEVEKPRLTEGQLITLYRLLFPLLMELSDQAAYAVADFMSPNYFVTLMNKRAQSMGMEDTVFVDVAGKELGNISTKQDIFNLAKYLYFNRSFILGMTLGVVTDPSQKKPDFEDMTSKNLLEGMPGYKGGILQHDSQSGLASMFAVFEITVREEKRPIMIMVVDSTDYKKDIKTILEHVIAFYQ